jgi:hypothetical protein
MRRHLIKNHDAEVASYEEAVEKESKGRSKSTSGLKQPFLSFSNQYSDKEAKKRTISWTHIFDWESA